METAKDRMAIVQGQKVLRRGYTTGTTATAAAKYALMSLAGLLGDGQVHREYKQIEIKREVEGETLQESYEAEIIRVMTPSGLEAEVEVKEPRQEDFRASLAGGDFYARVTAVKDSGDDPDVTHRAEIGASLFLEAAGGELGASRDYLYVIDLEDFAIEEINTYEGEEDYQKSLATYLDSGKEKKEAGQSGKEAYFFLALRNGPGVGWVTKKGLAPALDHGAINPGPRKMLRDHLVQVVEKSPALQKRLAGQVLVVEIFVKKGEDLAQKTFNPKLGIQGGISIIGTSGIVEPMSEKALVDTIKTELDQFRAEGQKPLLICPGNYGQDFIQDQLGIDMDKSVKVSNYIGEALDYMVYLGIQEALFVGHAGKLIKLAASIMNTHSSYADGRGEILASHGGVQGASPETMQEILAAISVDEMLGALLKNGDQVFSKTMTSIKEAIRRNLDHRTRGKVRVEFIVFTSQYGMMIESDGAKSLAQRIQEEE